MPASAIDYQQALRDSINHYLKKTTNPHRKESAEKILNLLDKNNESELLKLLLEERDLISLGHVEGFFGALGLTDSRLVLIYNQAISSYYTKTLTLLEEAIISGNTAKVENISKQLNKIRDKDKKTNKKLADGLNKQIFLAIAQLKDPNPHKRGSAQNSASEENKIKIIKLISSIPLVNLKKSGDITLAHAAALKDNAELTSYLLYKKVIRDSINKLKSQIKKYKNNYDLSSEETTYIDLMFAYLNECIKKSNTDTNLKPIFDNLLNTFQEKYENKPKKINSHLLKIADDFRFKLNTAFLKEYNLNKNLENDSDIISQNIHRNQGYKAEELIKAVKENNIDHLKTLFSDPTTTGNEKSNHFENIRSSNNVYIFQPTAVTTAKKMLNEGTGNKDMVSYLLFIQTFKEIHNELTKKLNKYVADNDYLIHARKKSVEEILNTLEEINKDAHKNPGKAIDDLYFVLNKTKQEVHFDHQKSFFAKAGITKSRLERIINKAQQKIVACLEEYNSMPKDQVITITNNPN